MNETIENKNYFMNIAINEAKKAAKKGDVPVGACVVCNNKIIAKAHNKKELKKNAILHAEIIAISHASKKLKSYRLNNCDLYVTFEPCLMCVGAILSARINNVYFGAFDTRFGASEQLVNNKFNHTSNFEGGILESECSSLISNFFKNIRESKKDKNKN